MKQVVIFSTTTVCLPGSFVVSFEDDNLPSMSAATGSTRSGIAESYSISFGHYTFGVGIIKITVCMCVCVCVSVCHLYRNQLGHHFELKVLP